MRFYFGTVDSEELADSKNVLIPAERDSGGMGLPEKQKRQQSMLALRAKFYPRLTIRGQ
jgi:hypothetical protein